MYACMYIKVEVPWQEALQNMTIAFENEILTASIKVEAVGLVAI